MNQSSANFVFLVDNNSKLANFEFFQLDKKVIGDLTGNFAKNIFWMFNVRNDFKLSIQCTVYLLLFIVQFGLFYGPGSFKRFHIGLPLLCFNDEVASTLGK